MLLKRLARLSSSMTSTEIADFTKSLKSELDANLFKEIVENKKLSCRYLSCAGTSKEGKQTLRALIKLLSDFLIKMDNDSVLKKSAYKDIVTMRILQDKGLYSQAGYILNKANEQAKKHELDVLKLLLLSEELETINETLLLNQQKVINKDVTEQLETIRIKLADNVRTWQILAELKELEFMFQNSLKMEGVFRDPLAIIYEIKKLLYRVKDIQVKCSLHFSLGISYKLINRPNEALVFHKKAFALFESSEHLKQSQSILYLELLLECFLIAINLGETEFGEIMKDELLNFKSDGRTSLETEKRKEVNFRIAALALANGRISMFNYKNILSQCAEFMQEKKKWLCKISKSEATFFVLSAMCLVRNYDAFYSLASCYRKQCEPGEENLYALLILEEIISQFDSGTHEGTIGTQQIPRNQNFILDEVLNAVGIILNSEDSNILKASKTLGVFKNNRRNECVQRMLHKTKVDILLTAYMRNTNPLDLLIEDYKGSYNEKGESLIIQLVDFN